MIIDNIFNFITNVITIKLIKPLQQYCIIQVYQCKEPNDSGEEKLIKLYFTSGLFSSFSLIGYADLAISYFLFCCVTEIITWN